MSSSRVLSLEGYPGVFQVSPNPNPDPNPNTNTNANPNPNPYPTPTPTPNPNPNTNPNFNPNLTPIPNFNPNPNPGVFQTPPRHARALAALVTAEGQRRLKFVVGLREPLALGFSLW